MRRSLQSVWATVLFCLGLLTSHCGEARVLTEAQSGPLYRVLGYPLSISCNVSGFSNQDTRKEFEFRMFRPENGKEINIISTDDQDFSYAVYMKRVFNNEITLEHVSPNSVLFKIKHLEEKDEGDYECFVINPEQTYDGTYSVKTTVKVIVNSLIISSPVSASLSHDEGDSLTLTCQASSNTVQHTHLSVTWYLHKDGEDNARPIISLERDLTLSPGQGFEGRYQAGLIGLDKVGEATYRLKMAQLELSDQGKIYCQAQEWIQDPDRSWYSIAQKSADATTLNVKAKEVVDKGSLVVRVSAQQATLQEGQELSLSCSVDAQNLAERFFSVAWLRENVEITRIGPTGVVSVGPEYSGREKEGELRATRTGNKDHRLILRPVRTQDQGEYVCRAWPQDRGADGAFTQGAAQDSSSQLVTISPTESGLSVEMEKKDVSVNEGDRLKLTCKVGGVKGQLSVTWEHKSPLFSNVISLSQEGVMEVGEEFRQRSIMAMRPAADTFSLELNEVRQADAGVYQCTVSEWTITSNGKVQKTNSQSQTGTVSVVLTESFLKVSLRSRNTLATVGEEVELLCRLRGPRLPMTLTWSLQRENASSPDNILTLYPNGNINWSGDQRRYQVKTESSQNEVYQTLLIMGASHREAGRYQCEVSVILESRYKKLPPSNLLAMMVKNPVSELSLTSNPPVERNINTDIDIKCSVIKATSPLSRFAVTWLVQHQAGSKTILSSNRDAVVTFGAQVELSHGQRISMKRSEGPSFELTIRQAWIGDSGLYMCKVVEWLQDPRGQWYELPPASTTTELHIIEPENNLTIVKDDVMMNVTGSQEFAIPCHITTQSSQSSVFQVTWFWQKESGIEQHPIFTAHRNSTLQDRDGRGERLRFGHPVPNHFNLTVFKPVPADSGLYFCEVEEWLLSLSQGWRKVAAEKSGKLTVSVYIEGGDVEPVCTQGIMVGVLTGVIICLLVVVFLLALKVFQGSGAKKPDDSLWAEEHPLKPKPSAED